MDINWLAILGGAVVSMGVGFVWFGPLFGKKWLEVIGATDADLEKRKEMQKNALPLYLIQFILALLQIWVLATQVAYSGIQTPGPAMVYGFFIWLGFVMPTVAGMAMWNNHPPKVKWTLFALQAGYYLVLLLLYGFILGSWN